MFKKFQGGGNPLLRNSLQNESASSVSIAHEGTMTAQGAINKTLLLFGILLITAVYNYQAQSSVLMIGGAIIGFILVLVNVFKKEYSPYIAPAYAAMEGLFVGGISGIYAGFGGGIVI